MCAQLGLFLLLQPHLTPAVSHCSPLPFDSDTRIRQAFSQPLLTCCSFPVPPFQGQGDLVEDTTLFL